DLLDEIARLAATWPAGTVDRADGLVPIIGRCAAIKAAIVSRDEREVSGERQLLNLGHTVGHAIEAAAGYGAVLHGEAVALGLVAAGRGSAALGLARAELEGEVAAVLALAGLPTDLSPWLRPDVVDRIGADKKRVGGVVGFVTIGHPGQAEVRSIGLDQLGQIL